jgi:hypothetical protein
VYSGLKIDDSVPFRVIEKSESNRCFVLFHTFLVEELLTFFSFTSVLSISKWRLWYEGPAHIMHHEIYKTLTAARVIFVGCKIET